VRHGADPRAALAGVLGALAEDILGARCRLEYAMADDDGQCGAFEKALGDKVARDRHRDYV
jgi:hypothetical protein